MKRLALCALLVAGCAPSLVKQAHKLKRQSKAEAVVEFDAAVRLIRLGPPSYPSALERLAAAEKIDPSLREAWFDSGWVLLHVHRGADAVRALQRALDLDPSDETTRRALGGALASLGRLDEAEKVYRAGLPRGDAADSPAERARRVELASVLRRLHRLDEAATEIQRVLRFEPRSSPALAALGRVYHARKQEELAELVLRRALEIEPGRAPAWNDLGLVLLGLRRDAEAFAAFDQAVKLDPSLGEARYNRAAVYLDTGDYAAAARELGKLTEARPELLDGWVALGVAARGQRRLDEALRAYEHALTLDPQSPAALYDLAILQMDFRKDPTAARDALQRFLRAADGKHERRADAEARLKELARAPAQPAGGG